MTGRGRDPWGLDENETNGRTGGCDEDSAAGDEVCQQLLEAGDFYLRALHAPAEAVRKHVETLWRFSWSAHFRFSSGLGIGKMAKAAGIEGISFVDLDTTDLKEDCFSLELQEILGIGIDFQAGKGFDIIPRLTGFKIKGLVFNKYLWTQENGWTFYNPGTLEAGVAWYLQFGATFELDDLLTELYGNVVDTWHWVVSGQEFWLR